MKQNAGDGFQGAMAVVEGIGAVKMGPRLSSGEFFRNLPRSPGQWARQTVQGVRQGASRLAGAPGRIARGVRQLFRGGRQGLMRFRERIRGLFARRSPGRADLDVDAPATRQQRQADLDEARGKQVRDMDNAEFRAELLPKFAHGPTRTQQ